MQIGILFSMQHMQVRIYIRGMLNNSFNHACLGVSPGPCLTLCFNPVPLLP